MFLKILLCCDDWIGAVLGNVVDGDHTIVHADSKEVGELE